MVMTYKVLYEDRPPIWTHQRSNLRTETFDSENAALGRARQLLEDEERYGVSIRNDRGEVVAGVRLQLKLGFPVE
jgi:hypothetical protein